MAQFATLNRLFDKYTELVSENPHIVRNVESGLRMLSYIVPGAVFHFVNSLVILRGLWHYLFIIILISSNNKPTVVYWSRLVGQRNIFR